jgi:hypothetical protein
MKNIINSGFVNWNIEPRKLIRLEAIDLYCDNHIFKILDISLKARNDFKIFFTSLEHDFNKVEEVKEIPNALMLRDSKISPLGGYFILDKETGFFKRYFVHEYPEKNAKMIKDFAAEIKSFEKGKNNRMAAVIRPGKSQDLFNAVEGVFKGCLCANEEKMSCAVVRKLISDMKIK